MDNQQTTTMLLARQPRMAKDALAELTRYIKIDWLSSVSGVHRNYIAAAISGKRNGSDYSLPQEQVDKLNNALLKIGNKTFIATITETPQHGTELTDGENTAEQLHTLSAVLRIRSLLIDKMGVTKHWSDTRIMRTTHNDYNRFTSDEIFRINQAIRQLSMQIMTTLLVSDKKSTPNES